MRLTPHRHPRATHSGAEAKRTPERTNKRETDLKRGDREAAPLKRVYPKSKRYIDVGGEIRHNILY